MRFFIASKQFGYLMFASEIEGCPFSDNQDEAIEYGPMDNPATKLIYWKAIASLNGLDPGQVYIESL